MQDQKATADIVSCSKAVHCVDFYGVSVLVLHLVLDWGHGDRAVLLRAVTHAAKQLVWSCPAQLVGGCRGRAGHVDGKLSRAM